MASVGCKCRISRENFGEISVVNEISYFFFPIFLKQMLTYGGRINWRLYMFEINRENGFGLWRDWTGVVFFNLKIDDFFRILGEYREARPQWHNNNAFDFS